MRRFFILFFFVAGCIRGTDSVVVPAERTEHKTEKVAEKTTRRVKVHRINTTWQRSDPVSAGWSTERLEKAREFSERIGSTAVVIIDDNRIVDMWGDATRPVNLRSIRKPLLGALIGRAVASGAIKLDATLAQLNIDDRLGLSATERQATVRDLLSSSSAIFHPAAYQAPGDDPPARGSLPRGTFLYNNWDFNALGTIYEHASGQPIFEAFRQQIAVPVGMEHYDVRRQEYRREELSDHPAYLFSLSALDLARFGAVVANQGEWNDREIVPSDWIRVSTQPYIKTNREGQSFGFLWWILSEESGLPSGTVLSTGAGGQGLWIDPQRNIVVVHLVDVWKLGLAAKLGRLVSNEQRLELLQLIESAAP